MSNQEVDYDIFLLFLKASSKQQVVEICEDAFKNRDKEIPPNHLLKTIMESFNIDSSEASKLVTSITNFIKLTLFYGHCSIETISQLFPDEFHKNLRDLLSKIIAEKYATWRVLAVSDSVSMPRLTEFDWRVDLKMASGKIARMNEPTCILHLKIHDPGVPEDHEDRFQTLNVELSKEKLDTMLHGLGRIRDQLSTVAKK